ncbi:hypothetical protein ACFU7T_12135 [Streptomyces sp. NPDC057555]|uniref:hypothetical protein n=1 Tax=Streptomyces sp. NPDC057555 TaxID=3346166 RepID=UPI0036AEC6A8
MAFGKKKNSDTVNAVKSEAKRLANGEDVTSGHKTQAAQRKALLHDVPGDIRKQGRREYTQEEAARRRGE